MFICIITYFQYNNNRYYFYLCFKSLVHSPLLYYYSYFLLIIEEDLFAHVHVCINSNLTFIEVILICIVCCANHYIYLLRTFLAVVLINYIYVYIYSNIFFFYDIYINNNSSIPGIIYIV